MKNNKKGGRPKSDPDTKLIYRVVAKLCKNDYEKLKSQAKELGLSAAELVRRAIKNIKIEPRFTPEQASWIRQLSGMANNLNQLARKAHKDGFGSVFREYKDMFARIDNVLKWLENDS